jgi:hypothetical protein
MEQFLNINKAIMLFYNDANGSAQNRIKSTIQQNPLPCQRHANPYSPFVNSTSALASSHCVVNFRAPEGEGNQWWRGGTTNTGNERFL